MNLIILELCVVFTIFLWPRMKLWKGRVMLAISTAEVALILDALGYPTYMDMASMAAISIVILDCISEALKRERRLRAHIAIRIFRMMAIITLIASIVVSCLNFTQRYAHQGKECHRFNVKPHAETEE